jgi:hypothetical protein
MPFHILPLPPANRAYGSPDPANDMNAVLNTLGSRFGNEFHINDYGADPTGATLSDSAWANCYADATASLQANSGALIMLGGGQYKFTTNTVAITDPRIGLMGQGRVSTTIFTNSTGGILVSVTGPVGGSQGCAPVSGFNLWGWPAGPGTTGLRYGDRLNGYLECSVSGFGGTGARGIWFQDNLFNSEGTFAVCAVDNCTVCYDFDQVTPQQSGGSFDYSELFLHCGVTCVPVGASATGLRMINGMHSGGSKIHLAGNIRSESASFTATAVQIGNSSTDTAHIGNGSTLNFSMECDNSTGTVNDLVIQGTANGGINKSNGVMWFPNFGGSYTAGSVTGGATVTMWGYFVGPLFTSHGTLTTLGSASAGLSTYVG